MSDALVLIIVVLFFFVPVIVVFGLFPIYLYNVAWRAFSRAEPIMPVFGASTMGSTVYFRVSGWFAKAYGAVCLCHGASGQGFVVDFMMNLCGDCKVTPSQKIELWVWLATLGPLILGRFWMPSARAQRIDEPSDAEKVLFWNGVLRCAMGLVRSDRSAGARRKTPRRTTSR